MASILIIIGLGVYVLLWFDPEIAPYPKTGAWRSVPNWLRRLTRRGAGPVVIAAASVQAAAVVTLGVGIARTAGFMDGSQSDAGRWALALSWSGSLLTWAILALQARDTRSP